MNIKIWICLTVAALGFCPSVLWADTFMIETHVSVALENMGDNETMRVIGTESGLMDTLFDQGHIFFNSYNIPNENGQRTSAEDMMLMAKEQDADYMVKIVPDGKGVAWQLYVISSIPKLMHESYEKFSQVRGNYSGGERWAALGAILGGRMLDLLTDNSLNKAKLPNQ